MGHRREKRQLEHLAEESESGVSSATAREHVRVIEDHAAAGEVFALNNWGRATTTYKGASIDHPRCGPNADWLYRQNTHPLVSGHRDSRGWRDPHAPRHGWSRDRRSKALLLTARFSGLSPVPEDAHFVGATALDL